MTVRNPVLLLIGILFFSCGQITKAPPPLRIWDNQPAISTINDLKSGWENDPEWLKAFPIGNGFLGAMVFGDVNQERLQLNEKTLWSGSPDDNNNPAAFASLSKIRELLFNGKYKEATELTLKTQICKGAGSGQGNGSKVPFGCYQTLGDLWLDFGKTSKYENYIRELDLNRGMVTVTYLQDGIKFKREIFASYPDRALIMRLSSDKKGALSFKSSLNRPERFETRVENDQLVMTGILNNGKGGDGMVYAARLKAVSTGGSVTFTDHKMEVTNADEVVLILTASTNYKQDYPAYLGNNPRITTFEQLNKVLAQPYATLLKRHIEDYSALSGKVSLKLTTSDPDTIPTNVRLKNQDKNPDDLHLQEIYFQFGRYLLISSSREGSLPANLQGMWANKIQTAWNGDYHTDINVQMNYWPADITNLSECYGPLTDLIESVVKPGEVTAAVQYKASGWCIHPTTNVWGFTAPGEHPGWGMHVGAGAWLCQHLWDHYTYSADPKYLERVYPIMLESARFYLDWLVKDPATGKFVSGPAASPENTFIAPDGSTCQISMGPSHDQEVIHELFTNVLKASELLKDNNPLLTRIESSLKNLAVPQIGSDGRLMEWGKEYKETEPTHRHVSHLYMLHPGNQVDPQRTPELAAAVRKSLDARTDIGTGWSLAWKVNFWARLKDGDRAYKLLKNLLHPTDNGKINMSNAGGTYPNLFCGHPPFQIDGNFGGTSGIAEMLLQSHNDYIELLPALPTVWKNGEVKGLVTRGGYVVNMKWENNQLISAQIYPRKGGSCIVKYKDKTAEFRNLEKGNLFSLDAQLKEITK